MRSAPCCQAHEVVAVTNHKRMFLFILVHSHTDAVLVAALPVTGNARSCRRNSDVSTLQSAHGHAAAGGVCGGQTGAGRNAVRHCDCPRMRASRWYLTGGGVSASATECFAHRCSARTAGVRLRRKASL